ncbi:MAG TPA: BTAD domain-containing putative transcriptional regulator, partial [Candidatus Dormibacteraeota bacterium]|nr:BTAD domain-containing putative transcriptional regulator [Candidatus Dormibacteraeota bacterium]
SGRFAQARALLTELGLLDLLDGLTEEEATLAARRGETDLAERLAAAVVASRREAGDTEGTASALQALGEIRVRASRPEAALEPLDEAGRLFETLGRAYQRCLARLFLALACHRLERPERAGLAASEALDLAARFDYLAAVLRVADLDDGFRRFLATLPGSPPDLRLPPVEQGAAAGAVSPIPSDGADLYVRLLGPIEVSRTPGRVIPAGAWKIRRALQLFCLLASARAHRATKDRIVDALWEDARLPMIDKNFHPTISFLRRALNHGHNVPKSFIVCERGAYLLNPDYRYDIDTERFEAHVRAARGAKAAGQADAALADYEAALALYRGPFLEEEYHDWAEPLRTRYEELHLAALKEAGGLHLEKKDVAAAVDCLQHLIRRDPLSEEASVILMRALAVAGNRAAIGKEYDRLVAALHDELGKLPLPSTRRAYDDALGPGKPRPTRARPKDLGPSPG